MTFVKKTLTLASLLAVALLVAQPAQAQQTADGGATTGGTSGGIGTGTNQAAIGAETGSATLSTEVDTSAFDAIDRGDTIGDTGATGFGLAGEAAGGPGGSAGFGGIGGGGLGAFGGLGGFGGLNNLFGGGFGPGGQGQTKPIIRTRVRSRVKVAPVAPAMVQREAGVRLLNQTSPERKLAGVKIEMVGRTAILTGSVGSESDRRMSELMLRLEPGVSKVDNRLVVLPERYVPSGQ